MTACPQCGSMESDVRDSRPSEIGIRRRQFCRKCLARWTTYELSIASIECLRMLREEIDRSIENLRGLLERVPTVPVIPYQAHPTDRIQVLAASADEDDAA